MGLTCCLPIRDGDDQPENPNASHSRNHFTSEFHSLFDKIKGVFNRNEVHLTHPVQPQVILNANSNRVHPNYAQNPPEIAVIPNKTAASVNRPEIITDISSSHNNNHPNVETEQNQPSDLNLELLSVVIPHEAATSENPEVSDAAAGRDSVSVGRDADVSLQSSEGGFNSETVIDNNSCAKEASANIEKTFTNANGVFYQVFPSSDEEDVCPTCLEDYEPENPKIIAECSHHFHLSCIYDWLERSERCPICFRLMVIKEN